MFYRAYAPPADLAAWVECAWTLEGRLAAGGEVILPDGRQELIFHLGSPPREGAALQAPILMAGQAAGPVELWPAGDGMKAIGVRWRPGALPPGNPAETAWARRTRERLGEAGEPIPVLWAALRALRRETPDEAVAWSVRGMETVHGQGPLERFVPHGLGLRQWQRRFAERTGFTPKVFARVIRFQHLIALERAGRRRRWAELALEAGFYDQAHLANEFRAFSGQSPEAFFRAGRGMAEFYAKLPDDDAFFQDAPASRGIDSGS